MSKMGALALEILEQESREAEISDSDKARVHFRHETPRHDANSHLPTALMPVEVMHQMPETLRMVKYFQPGLRDTVNGELIEDAATFWHDRVCTAVMPYGVNQYGVVIQNETAKVWEKPVVEVTPLLFFPNDKTVCYFADGIWQQVMLHPMFVPLREDEMPAKVSRYVKDMRWGAIIRPELGRQVIHESPSQPKAQSTVVEEQVARVEAAGEFPKEVFVVSEVEKMTSVSDSQVNRLENMVSWQCPSCGQAAWVNSEARSFDCAGCLAHVLTDEIPF